MRAISSFLTNLLAAGGPYVGANRGSSRVTVEPNWYLNTTTGNVGALALNKLPVRSWQNITNDQSETEILNLKSVIIDRTLDQDASTMTMVQYNQQMAPDTLPSSLSGQLGEPGYYSWSRGSSVAAQARWNQIPNEWKNVLGPNALLRTYQGYGGQGLSIPDAVAAGNIMLTGVFLVDTVTLDAAGLATFTCRDMCKLLIDQQVYPPLIPQGFPYPLEYILANQNGGGAVGNYSDFSDIVTDLLLWSGWWLFDVTLLLSSRMPAVYGNIETTGTNDAQGRITADVFDKKPVIDAIKVVRDIVGYVFRIDETGAARFEPPNWFRPGNYYDNGVATGYIPVMDERLNVSAYSMVATDAPLRSQIIVTVDDPAAWAPTVNPTTVLRPSNVDPLRGMLKPLMMGVPVQVSAAQQALFAQLIALQIQFAQRAGQVTAVFNPAIGLDTQVQIFERTTGEASIHYVKGIHTEHDLDSGKFTMTLTTNWLGS